MKNIDTANMQLYNTDISNHLKPHSNKSQPYKSKSYQSMPSILRSSIVLLSTALLTCSLSHAADKLEDAQSPLSAANTVADAPLHEHSSVSPTSPVEAVSPESSNNKVTSKSNMPTTMAKPTQNMPANESATETSTPPEPDNKIVIVARPQVTGLWAMSIPGANCTEYYNFMEKGDVVIKSGAEWTYGKYAFQVPATPDEGTPVLGLRIQYDNLKMDCSGNAVDQRGEEQQQYVQWTGASSMNFCASQDGSQCFASLKKVLP